MSIEVRNVTKNYGSTCALDHVSLKFEENKIYGLLGRNGAGKTTLLNIISNRIFASEGEVLIDGLPARENDMAQQKIYLMSEKDYYPEKAKIKDIFDGPVTSILALIWSMRGISLKCLSLIRIKL